MKGTSVGAIYQWSLTFLWASLPLEANDLSNAEPTIPVTPLEWLVFPDSNPYLGNAEPTIPVIAVTAGMKPKYSWDTIFTDSGEFEPLWFDRLLLRVVFPRQVENTMISVYVAHQSAENPTISFQEKGAVLSFGLPERLTFVPDAISKRLTLDTLKDLRVLQVLPETPLEYNKTILPMTLTPNLTLKNVVGWQFAKYEEIIAKVASFAAAIEFKRPGSNGSIDIHFFLDLAELQVLSPGIYEGQILKVIFPTKDEDGQNPWITFNTQWLRLSGTEVQFLISEFHLQDYIDGVSEFISATDLEMVERFEKVEKVSDDSTPRQ